MISYQRLIKNLRDINNGKMPGIYDWFIDEKDVLNILLNVSGVNYIYLIDAMKVNELLKINLSTDNQILGFYEYEEEDEYEPEELKMGDLSANNN